MIPNIFETAIVLVSLIVFSFVSLEKKALDKKGVAIAIAVGLLVFLSGNIFDFFLMVVFFVVADASTKYARSFSKKKHEVRTTENIIGNSGAALIVLFLGLQIGFLGAVAAALADTLSSEIGLLSKKKPVLITTFKTVEPGTDGGITSLGCLAALADAAIIAATYYFAVKDSFSGIAIAILLAGFSGSIADSILGALFERKGCLNNTHVNFLGSSTGAIIAFALSKLLGF